jgi:hypothetical protein
VCVCVRARMHVYMSACVCMSVHACLRAHMHVCTPVYTCVHVHVCTHACCCQATVAHGVAWLCSTLQAIISSLSNSVQGDCQKSPEHSPNAMGSVQMYPPVY